jgi:hypothetical protein
MRPAYPASTGRARLESRPRCLSRPRRRACRAMRGSRRRGRDAHAATNAGPSRAGRGPHDRRSCLTSERQPTRPGGARPQLLTRISRGRRGSCPARGICSGHARCPLSSRSAALRPRGSHVDPIADAASEGSGALVTSRRVGGGAVWRPSFRAGTKLISLDPLALGSDMGYTYRDVPALGG